MRTQTGFTPYTFHQNHTFVLVPPNECGETELGQMRYAQLRHAQSELVGKTVRIIGPHIVGWNNCAVERVEGLGATTCFVLFGKNGERVEVTPDMEILVERE